MIGVVSVAFQYNGDLCSYQF